jgi:hypothetical protein
MSTLDELNRFTAKLAQDLAELAGEVRDLKQAAADRESAAEDQYLIERLSRLLAEIALAVDVSEVEALYMKCDRALTIETNDGTSPDDTISLVAGEPLVWSAASGLTNPLTTDITSIFATLAAGDAATLEIEILQDATP